LLRGLFAATLPTAAMKHPAKLSVDEPHTALEIPTRSSYVLALPIGAVPGIPGDARPNAA
jgi:hypothetical protein